MEDLRASNVEACGLQETRQLVKGQREVNQEGWMYFWSGHDNHRQGGVGLLLHPRVAKAMMGSPAFVSDRIMKVSLEGTVRVTLVVIYAPTERASHQAKDSFYTDLNDALAEIPSSHCVVILGDFNAQVGSQHECWQGSVGRHGVLPPSALLPGQRTVGFAHNPHDRFPSQDSQGSQHSLRDLDQGSQPPSHPAISIGPPQPPTEDSTAAHPAESAPLAPPIAEALRDAAYRDYLPALHESEDSLADIARAHTAALLADISEGPRLRYSPLPNSNGIRCLQLCVENELFVANTMFQHRPEETATWYGPRAEHRAIIDLILVSKRFRSSVLDAKVLPDAISHRTDHRLVVCDIRLNLRRHKGTGQRAPSSQPLVTPGPREWGGLTQAQWTYTHHMSEACARIEEQQIQAEQQRAGPYDKDAEWAFLAEALRDAACEALPKLDTRPRRAHISPATAALAAQKREALKRAKDALHYYTGTPSDSYKAAWVAADLAYRELSNSCRAAARADHRAFLLAETAEINNAYQRHHSAAVFKQVNKLVGRRQDPPVHALRGDSGKLATSPEALGELLATHNEKTQTLPPPISEEARQAARLTPWPPPPINNPNQAPQGATIAIGHAKGPVTRQAQALANVHSAAVNIEAPPIPQAKTATEGSEAATVATQPPTLEEVMAAIQRLNNTAPGSCGIDAPMLKFAGVAGARCIHHLITGVWVNGKAPGDWKKALMTYIYKGKGCKTAADNYRGISLLSVCSKVYVNILISRLTPILEPFLHESQCGFRPERGCSDQLFTMRRLCELARASRTPLWVAFVDYRKAFDCINRQALWEILALRGVPEHLIQLVRDLYEGCEGQVMVQSCVSRPFSIATGVRQGCALSPLLFNVFIDHIFRTALPDHLIEAHGYPVSSEDTGQLHPPAHPKAHPNAKVHHLGPRLYADDSCLVASSKASLQTLLECVERTSTAWGMTINYGKTKAMQIHPLTACSSRAPRPHQDLYPLPSDITLAGGCIQFVRSFTYLGSIFTVDGSLDEDIQHRIGRTRRAAAQLSALWRQHHVDLAVKILMCKAIIPPTLLYGAETWALSASQTRQLDTALHHVLRQVLGIRLIDRVTNSEIRDRCGQQPDVAALTQQARLRFLGHIVRRKPDREGRQHSARVLLFATHTPKASGLPRRGGHSITDLLNQDLQGLGIMSSWYKTASIDRPAWRETVNSVTEATQA